MVSVTPQTGQATLARLEEHGWVRRRSSDRSDRVLTAELTASGKRLLHKARETAEGVNEAIWLDIPVRELKAMESSLRSALAQLGKA
jgi:DNA-binding MarR family transcriptional regulator